jgi:hypothetical protein
MISRSNCATAANTVNMSFPPSSCQQEARRWRNRNAKAACYSLWLSIHFAVASLRLIPGSWKAPIEANHLFLWMRAKLRSTQAVWPMVSVRLVSQNEKAGDLPRPFSMRVPTGSFAFYETLKRERGRG